MKPIVIITPCFGKELKGGAEQQAWQVATRLVKRGHEVEVLTSCCRSFQDDWSVNHVFFEEIEGKVYLINSSNAKFDDLNDYVKISRDMVLTAHKP